jgi:predicted HAD superfamily Cof-like phosphohydrolase
MKTNLDLVRDFHQRFAVPVARVPVRLDGADAEFRVKFLREELAEYERALADGDLVKQFDALIDLVYVAYGTALWHGFPLDLGFRLVHAANMTKERAESAADSEARTGRGHTHDIVKPADWESPEPHLRRLLEVAGGQL